MKALLMTSIYPSLSEPGRGPYNHNVFTAISKHCEVRVVSPQPCWNRLATPKTLLKTPFETQTGLDTYLPTYWSIPRFAPLHGQAMYLSLKPFLSKLRKEFPFDVIFAVWAYPDAVAAAHFARDSRCPLVIKTMGSDVNALPEIAGLRTQIIRAFHQASSVVSVSAALRDKVVAMGIPPARALVQHNGVDGEKFTINESSEARRKLDLPPDRRIVCYVGRLGHEKGLDVLVEAMARRPFTETELHLVGGGELEESLRSQVQQLNLDGKVFFHGMRPHEEIPAWLTACDVFCLPSRREGCPNVVLEALASGRPVVASHVGGVPELISERNGVLVPSENPERLAQALEYTLDQKWDAPTLRESVEFLSWDTVGFKYFSTLLNAVTEKG
jgi:glycosyltransferase involved in cell wall biosynthesis